MEEQLSHRSEYAAKLEEALRRHADPEQAESMEAYMRGQFPFLGIRSPLRSEVTKQFIQTNKPPKGWELTEAVTDLWSLPEREFHYTALMLLDRQRKRTEPVTIELYEHLIVDKAWWDTVDMIASRLVGAHFLRYPGQVSAYTEKWFASGNLWLMRTALLFQLSYKENTDQALLFGLIGRCAQEKDFFIRKAIGWSLREYSKTDEAPVRGFVEKTELNPLSVREALKYVEAKSKSKNKKTG